MLKKNKKSNDYKTTTDLDLWDLVQNVAMLTICILGIGFIIFSIICAIGLLNSF